MLERLSELKIGSRPRMAAGILLALFAGIPVGVAIDRAQTDISAANWTIGLALGAILLASSVAVMGSAVREMAGRKSRPRQNLAKCPGKIVLSPPPAMPTGPAPTGQKDARCDNPLMGKSESPSRPDFWMRCRD